MFLWQRSRSTQPGPQRELARNGLNPFNRSVSILSRRAFALPLLPLSGWGAGPFLPLHPSPTPTPAPRPPAGTCGQDNSSFRASGGYPPTPHLNSRPELQAEAARGDALSIREKGPGRKPRGGLGCKASGLRPGVAWPQARTPNIINISGLCPSSLLPLNKKRFDPQGAFGNV